MFDKTFIIASAFFYAKAKVFIFLAIHLHLSWQLDTFYTAYYSDFLMILDRTIAPPSRKVETVHIPKADKHTLNNGVTIYSVRAGEQPVVRLELIFDAGSRFDVIGGESLFVSKMLTEGTKNFKAVEISEFFDQYGAFIEINQAFERLTITVHGLTKHLTKLLPMLKELITESVFPSEEFEMQRNIASQTLKVNLEKTAFVASQAFREQIFGKNHPYGKSVTQATIENITREAVTDFYGKQIKGKVFTIFLSGSFEETEISALNEVLGQMPLVTPEKIGEQFPESPVVGENLLINRPENLQSSIRLGRRLFNRSHPDFFKFVVTNTIFGGYFGSRLMKNIREEKGFTYGISSSLIPQREGGYLIIGTDVKKEFTQQTIDEIHKEIVRLQTEPISANELETAQNYMIGAFVGSLNTPFEVADRQKIVILEALPIDFYQNYIQKVSGVSAEDVMQIAQKYLQAAELCEVVVGGK
ncbi:peptidase M16 domain protein [Emticicia oligotrophica DSM 17448]|uniref:Peptidase M16 domain protein n=1 Tax=Emticicia oligotrophica (strain DSM 17448 / CIP 109782 / MTCC 6937 / GPTSA100-15) TaxID=929562 RepID=A0ABN4APP1_EMTOG|nr:pitrilysin family protein [Emticicia oligotrophica]AFK03131.1 peptidase M16 domain protein [Emticicia oligotrophica DSM 17448]